MNDGPAAARPDADPAARAGGDPATPPTGGPPTGGPPAGGRAAGSPTGGPPAGGPAAWVDAEPVPAAEVAAAVARLRAGPAGRRLPPDGTADGRQLRRWVAQRVVLRRLLEQECAARGLDAHTAQAVVPDPALLGTAAADVLATSPAARAVFAAVTGDTTVDEPVVRAGYDADPDQYARPERWLVRQAFLPHEHSRPAATGPDPAAMLPPTVATARPVEVDPATLLPEVRASPGRPVCTHLGWHLLVVVAVLPAGPVPYEDVRTEIAARLTDRRRQTGFARWLDAQVAARVRLAPGFEHPADPRQPDATHRH
jgi:[acyl-carrier-protein] S-malonyltransferase